MLVLGQTPIAWLLFAAPAPAADEPPAPSATATAAPSETAPAPDAGAEAPPPETPKASVPDSTWSALRGKQVAVETADGPVEGELASSDGDDLVVIAQDGTVQTVPKSEATAVRVVKSEPLTADKVEPPAKGKDEGREGDGGKGKDKGKGKGEEEGDEKGKGKRKHALLGAFTAHGAAYANWRGQGVSAGHAAYLMDWGIGVNPTPGFGIYAVGGGALAARIDNKTIRANYGRIAFMFAFGGKYYHSMFGAGVAFSRLRMPTELQKDIGLSVPFKIFGKLPLPHKLYIGIGLAYEFGIVRDWHRFVNVIGGQIVFGRW